MTKCLRSEVLESHGHGFNSKPPFGKLLFRWLSLPTLNEVYSRIV